MVQVLQDCIGTECEVYIDDILIFGSDEDEFCHRVNKVFNELQQKKMKIKASKCRLGASSIEYLGQIVDKNGLCLSKERTAALMNMRRPEIVTELRSFIGVANYFRNFTPDLGTLLQPLNSEAVGSKRRQINWSDDLVRVYERVKMALSNAQELSFIMPNGDIQLFTDASDYGCGGALYQKQKNAEGREELKPIIFVSKAFNPTQRKWTVGEMFALLYAVTKLHYLIAGRYFEVFTDHRNLIFESTTASGKVERWLQEYNFKINFIEGEKNITADTLSRLMVVSSTDVLIAVVLKLAISA